MGEFKVVSSGSVIKGDLKTQMTVQVSVCSAAQLFSSFLVSDQSIVGTSIIDSRGNSIKGVLTIPEYQRPYCWQELQLRSLLNDIRTQAKEHPELPYFLGSLILHQADGKLNIIDGQQRITTLALLACLQKTEVGFDFALASALVYEHPVSQQRIKQNLKWLKAYLSQQAENGKTHIDFNKLQFALVITQSEDDAYRFFETQNTGGVRLSGPDIIKAHHLRMIERDFQPGFAKQWEALGSLDHTVSALLKGRYWQRVNPRELPPHRLKKQVRDTIVSELAQQTGGGDDFSFGRTRRVTGLAGEVSHHLAQQGYDVRQPLNAGVNTIRFLSYFQHLYQHYWLHPKLPHLRGYQEFVAWLKNIEGCGYLQGLYEACLLLYISQFGEKQLEQAAKKIFRVVYSRRVSNQKSVRENSIPAFVRDNPVLDWIALSYTPEQCFSFLDSFTLSVDPKNVNKNGVKKRYMESVSKYFNLGLDAADYEAKFATALTQKIVGYV